VIGKNGQRSYDELVANALNGIYQCGEDGRFLRVNPALLRLLGYESEDDLHRTSLHELLADKQTAAVLTEQLAASDEIENAEISLQGRGSLVDALLNARAIRSEDGTVLCHEGILTNITHIKRQEEELIHLATHDPLTGLHNRREFSAILDRHLASVKRYGGEGALLWMDLDGFKEINDGLGHKVGDELLASVAHRMKSTIRESDVLARLGGDEFALLYPNVTSKQAEIAATRLLEAIRQHTAVLQGQSIRTTASMGIVLFPEHGMDSTELLMQADMAMYRAKEQGRNRFCVYTPGQEENMDAPEQRIDWLRMLREALESDGFVLYAQPILDLTTDKIVRYEILLRLLDRDGSIIPPGAFLDIADQFGLSADIDRWVLRKATEILSEEAIAAKGISFAINLSPRTMTDQEFIHLVTELPTLDVIGPVRLVMEITETAAIYNIHVAKDFLRTLRGQGHEIALDDFGMGFSSFYQLKNLDVDYLKIDGSFVRNLSKDPVDKHLVLAMVHLAESLGKKTIAEFVEDAETLEILRSIGVDCAQGFHIGRPKPLEDVLAEIR